MKTCTKCNTPKTVKEFDKNRTKKSGLSSHCKDCNRVASKANYYKNKDVYLERSNKNKEKILQFLYEYKVANPCACGEADPVCLDFHHVVPETKQYNLGNINKLGINIVKKEIKKCVVMCANCHRKLHATMGT